jgi:hypothetical protein
VRALQQRAVPALPDSKEIPTRPSEEDHLNMDSIEITLVSMPEKIHKLPVKKGSTNPKTPRKESPHPIKTSTNPERQAIHKTKRKSGRQQSGGEGIENPKISGRELLPSVSMPASIIVLFCNVFGPLTVHVLLTKEEKPWRG